MTDKRKSKKSAKAAAIETKRVGKKTSTKKAKGKKLKGAVQDDGGESESDLVVDGEGVVTVKLSTLCKILSLPSIRLTTIFSWTESLTWSLITAITDDDIVRQGLFPERGANASTSKGGGICSQNSSAGRKA